MKTTICCESNYSGSTMRHDTQRGMGMVEVLVAMLLLAIGVLGYAALQVRAVEATGDALNRSQAMLVLRGLAEQMRVNPTGQATYPAQVRLYTATPPSATAPVNCFNSAVMCSPTDMARFDAYKSAVAANDIGVSLGMTQCPGVGAAPVKRQCLFAAWGGTTLANVGATLSAASSTDCMDVTGIYQPQARCLMMEAY